MDKHIMQFAALGIAAVFALLYYFIPWVVKTIGQHYRKKSAEVLQAP